MPRSTSKRCWIWRSSIRLRVAAVPREVAGGDPGDLFRDRYSGAARAGYQRSPGDACPAGAAGEGVFGAGAGVHHVCGVQEDRAGDGCRGGSGRGVGDGGEAGNRMRYLRLVPQLVSNFYLYVHSKIFKGISG